MARTKSRPVRLSPTDRAWLQSRFVLGPARRSRCVGRARIVVDQDDPDRDGPVPTQEVVAERAGVHVDTVLKTSRVYVEQRW